MSTELDNVQGSSAPLDAFDDVSGWKAVTSGAARLSISRDEERSAMRLDFDFRGAGGFVVARREIARELPESYAISLDIGGDGPVNRLELKLCDASGRNVWWHRDDAFEFTRPLRRLRIPSSSFVFAWGPAGGGRLRRLGAVELAVVAVEGGAGVLWIRDMYLEDLDDRRAPLARASSALPGHDAEHAVDGSPYSSWRSGVGDASPWLVLDFGRCRDFGGLVIDWEPGFAARAFDLHGSDDGSRWRLLFAASAAGAPRSYLYMSEAPRARYLRLAMRGAVSPGIRTIEAKAVEFSRSREEFFHNVAAAEQRGAYPRYFYREQSYWSPIEIEGAEAPAIINQEGMIEARRGGFSLEPLLRLGGELLSWADCEIDQALEQGDLPLPSVRWRARGVTLTVGAFSAGSRERPLLCIRYRVSAQAAVTPPTSLLVAVRPFQVTPPWQAWRDLGAVCPIESLVYRDGALWVNGERSVLLLSAPAEFRAATFAQGGLAACVTGAGASGAEVVGDDFGFACGAFRFDFGSADGGSAEAAPRREYEIYLAVDLAPSAFFARSGAAPCAGGEAAPARAEAAPGAGAEAAASLGARYAAEVERWKGRLCAVRIEAPARARERVEVMRTATAHILVNRAGAALQPGPRRYSRAWIRDAAVMAAALLRMGHSAEVREFIVWYAAFQRGDGALPCCVDRYGVDATVEHDSHGQFIFTVMEYYRLSGDSGILRELWPAVLRACEYLESLCAGGAGGDPGDGRSDRAQTRGLLPESASHEGYLAQPLHSYWDDFWALRGIDDAAEMARCLDEPVQAQRLARLREALATDLYSSIAAVATVRGLDYVPASVEWADFDPSATAMAIVIADAARRLPSDLLCKTYDRYMAGARERTRAGSDWNNYTAYEIRVAAALLRLGRRDEANELLDFFIGDRRPRAWNQWPEISWRDPASPGHLGDLPHSWIGAEYVLAFLAGFAFEQPADSALVVAAGIPAAWLQDGQAVGISGLPTYYGRLDYRLRRENDATLRLSVLSEPSAPGVTLLVKPPLHSALRAVAIDGRRVDDFGCDYVSLPWQRCELLLTCR